MGIVLQANNSFSCLHVLLCKEGLNTKESDGEAGRGRGLVVGWVSRGERAIASNIPNDSLWGVDLCSQLSLVTESLCEIFPKLHRPPLWLSSHSNYARRGWGEII